MQMPQADLDETGKIATADFYAWYGLDDLETLDAEYASVRKFLDSTIELLEDNTQTEVSEVKYCADGKTKYNDAGYHWIS
jgi:hypothetical protein